MHLELFPGGKAQVRQTEESPLPNSEVKNGGGYIFTPSVRLHGAVFN
jgi:hypothetical protein